MVPDHTRVCPPHDFWVYVGVPVSGTCSTVRVQENDGWRWKVASGVDVRELRSEHLHEEGTRAHHAYHAKPHPQ